jgi:hypothetical protein
MAASSGTGGAAAFGLLFATFFVAALGMVKNGLPDF